MPCRLHPDRLQPGDQLVELVVRVCPALTEVEAERLAAELAPHQDELPQWHAGETPYAVNTTVEKFGLITEVAVTLAAPNVSAASEVLADHLTALTPQRRAEIVTLYAEWIYADPALARTGLRTSAQSSNR